MATRKLKNPELNKTVDSLQDAAHHLRNAVQMKIDTMRGSAAAELERVKTLARKNTDAAHGIVETAIAKAETRLHKAIDKAQKALDKAVSVVEKHNVPEAPTGKAAAKPVARKRPAPKSTGARK